VITAVILAVIIGHVWPASLPAGHAYLHRCAVAAAGVVGNDALMLQLSVYVLAFGQHLLFM
jgi:hypothetical protein